MAAGQGFGAWVPSYFVRVLGLSVTEAGALFGGAALVGGIVGGIVGGTLSDRRRRARPGGELEVSAVAAFAGAALVLVTLEAAPEAYPPSAAWCPRSRSTRCSQASWLRC